MALRNARDVYTRRGEGVSIWVVPSAAITRLQPGREGPVLRPGHWTRPTGTRPSTRSRRGCSTCDRRRPRASTRAPASTRRARRLRARARRRRADPGPAAGRVGHPGPAARGGRRAGQHRAGPARPGPHPALLRRQVEGAGRDEDDLAFLRDEREFRNVQLVEIPNGDFAVTMARQLVFSGYQLRAVRRAARLGRPDPGGAGRQGGQGGRLPPRPRRRSGCCGSATAPPSRTPGCRPRSTASGRTCDELFEPDAGSLALPGIAADPALLGRRSRPRLDAVLSRGDPDQAGADLARPRRPARLPHRAPRPPAAGDAAPAPRAPRGDLVSAATSEPATGCATSAGAVPDPEIPVLTLDDLGILRDVCGSTATAPSRSTLTPTYTGCPATAVIAGRRRDGAATGRGPAGPGAHGAVAGLDHRLDQRGGPPQAARVRHRAARAGAEPGRPAPLVGWACAAHAAVRPDTREISRFGSTPCKSLWSCRACAEPFDASRRSERDASADERRPPAAAGTPSSTRCGSPRWTG